MNKALIEKGNKHCIPNFVYTKYNIINIMEESPLLKIYADTEKIILYKRALFKNIALEIPSSPIQHAPKTSSSKIYICLHKLVSELQNYFLALAEHNKFELHLLDMSMITGKLK